jgi:hypothetical protein
VVSSRTSQSQPDLTGLEGEYAVRGWTRARVAGLIGSLLLQALLLLSTILVGDRWLIIAAVALLLFTLVTGWRTYQRPVTLKISSEGITIDREVGTKGHTHLPWSDIAEVYVAGAWQAHSTARTTTHQEVALPGLDRDRAAQLAATLRSVQ